MKKLTSLTKKFRAALAPLLVLATPLAAHAHPGHEHVAGGHPAWASDPMLAVVIAAAVGAGMLFYARKRDA